MYLLMRHFVYSILLVCWCGYVCVCVCVGTKKGQSNLFRARCFSSKAIFLIRTKEEVITARGGWNIIQIRLSSSSRRAF